jgi:uncharacterized protein YkwD
MTKQIVSLFLGLISFHFLFAQQNVSKDIYQSYSTSNFRTNNLFLKKIDPENVDYRLLNAAVFFCTNEQRLKYKRKELQHVVELENAAYLHSKQMGELSFFSHENAFDEKLRVADDRGKICGIQNPKMAENIVYFSSNEPSKLTYLELADKLIAMWKSSKLHWENILSNEAIELGCGVFVVISGDEKSFYGTQNFQFFDKVIAK